MQKYKVVASKSQKKYSLIISADSETQAKEKLHKDGYSVLTIHELRQEDIQGHKFLFQVEKDGEIKNGVIVGDDIFKLYIKLVDELQYNVIALYPEEEKDLYTAEKKQEMIQELQNGYQKIKLQQKQRLEKKQIEETFYLKKQIDETSVLIERSISKIETIFTKRSYYEIDDETFYKLEKIYEKLHQIKKSQNITKLREIGELALIKLAELEVKAVEKHKDEDSRKLLKETNSLLRQIGSEKRFHESSKDIKKIFQNILKSFEKGLSLKEMKKNLEKKKESLTKDIDKDSYSFLKTLLLIEKYQSKLKENNQEILKNIFHILNPIGSNEIKEKILLKRTVIKQNIAILKAKKNGGMGSYTRLKKGIRKTQEQILRVLQYLDINILIYLSIFSFIFLLLISIPQSFIVLNTSAIKYVCYLFFIYI